MTLLRAPHDGAYRNLPFYLAMEEWAAATLPPEDYFFCWHVFPTVIYGRNQDPQVEIDAAYCRAHGIEAWQRKSGGGCVYADDGNLMLSYITPSTDVLGTFPRYLQMVSDMLRQAGIEAAPNDHNDVLVDGRKISGNAYYRLPDRSIVHGTLLFRPDMDNMVGALTPSRAKLESNKVTSVAARIVWLTQLTDRFASLSDLQAFVEATLTDRTIVVTPPDIADIEAIASSYHRFV